MTGDRSESLLARGGAGPVSLSVIVPAFNAAPYIVRCLESLLDQELAGMEILVFDDASTDDTPDVVRRVQGTVPDRITLVPAGTGSRSAARPANRGLAATRNRGLASARGTWVGFVDGDDWVERGMFRRLIQAAEERSADVAICTGSLVNHFTGETRPFQDRETWERLCAQHPNLVDCRETPDLLLTDTSACRRLYRREFLGRIGFSFADGRLFEDVLANYQVLLATSAVALVDGDFYRYRTHHPGRITDRTDRQLLDGPWMLLRCAEALRGARATPGMWASFLAYQAWVVRWLCGQIDPRFRPEFVAEACRVAASVPEDGVAEFRRRFASDRRTVEVVERQVAGSAEDLA